MANDKTQPGIVRATAAQLLQGYPSGGSYRAFEALARTHRKPDGTLDLELGPRAVRAHMVAHERFLMDPRFPRQWRRLLDAAGYRALTEGDA